MAIPIFPLAERKRTRIRLQHGTPMGRDINDRGGVSRNASDAGGLDSPRARRLARDLEGVSV
jgi:hypothetical protein